MYTRLKRGPTDKVKEHVGPEGSIVLDTDLKNLRLQDGVTPGGFSVGDDIALSGPNVLLVGVVNVYTIVNYDSYTEYNISTDRGDVTINGNTIEIEVDSLGGVVILTISRSNGSGRSVEIPVEQDLGPGPTVLLAGTMEEGFFGECPVEELIDGPSLADMIGLAGTNNSNSAYRPWLKFALDGRILFVSMRPFRGSTSWDQINARNAVYGNLELNIGDRLYKCRLLTGANEDPTDVVSGHNPINTELSEWDRLMYPIHLDDPTNRNYADYTGSELWVDSSTMFTWCQETSSQQSSKKIVRGLSSLTYISTAESDAAQSNKGWRPVLELIS